MSDPRRKRPKPLRVPVDHVPRRSAVSQIPAYVEAPPEPEIPRASRPPDTARSDAPARRPSGPNTVVDVSQPPMEMDFRTTIDERNSLESEDTPTSEPTSDLPPQMPLDAPVEEPDSVAAEASERRAAPAPAPSVIQHSTVVIRGMVRVSEFPDAHPGDPAEGRMRFDPDEDLEAEFEVEPEDFADHPTNPGATLAELAAAAGVGELARGEVDATTEELDAEELEHDELELEPEPDFEPEPDPDFEPEPDQALLAAEPDAALSDALVDSDEPEELELDEVEEALLSDAPSVEPTTEPVIPPIPKPDQAEPPKVPPKKKRRAWYEALFNDDYLRTVRPPKPKEIERETDFIERALGLAPGASILDVGCGLGNHANALARRGYQVVGLDLSESMLARANDEARDEGISVGFVHGDMREIDFESAFDAILCWGTTFGYFDDDANQEVVAKLYRALKPRGLLLLDVVNRDHVIQQQPNLVWFEGDGCVCMEESKFNYFQSRLQVKRTVILDDGRQRESGYSLRLYPAHELGLLLHQQGFRVAEISGMIATPSVFFGATSPRMIILAERRSRETQKMKTVTEKRDRSEPPLPPSAAAAKSEPPEPPQRDVGRSEPPPPPGRSEPPSEPPE